ncbi:MAG: hypothetical protein JSV91_10525 [Phycisphaerales bacterium]|nr:MAG: hypothetical protein JSV91_10525 [Phycisphaerales bacterium]
MSRQWSADNILTMARFYQRSCVLTAAADLDLFTVLADGPRTAAEVAEAVGADRRGTATLLDALVAIELIDKDEDRYTVLPSVAELLTSDGKQSVLAMVRHQGSCLRRWDQLAHVVRSGQPGQRRASVRGEAGDEESFIEAMDNVNRGTAPALVAELDPPAFGHLLDVGGASGTWTIAFLRWHREAKATIFDLPHVMPLAERRIAAAGLAGRVTLVPGDFYTDPLPPGADLAWVSAIIHQNSRRQNRELLGKTFEALEDGGRIFVRDIVMDETRVSPRAGALFAINMLVATEGGGTFTFNEIREDLEAAGFTDVQLVREHEWMDAIVSARK